MQSPVSFEVHQRIEAERFRDRERYLSHMRALRSDARSGGIASRILARRHAATTGQPVLAYDLHELTDSACRLADGAVGRIAIRRLDGAWAAVCVAP